MQKRKGFTLVELVIVIAVIAILAGVLIGTFASVINKANESAKMQEMKAAEHDKKANDILEKLNNAQWFGWEDLETKIGESIQTAVNGAMTQIKDTTQMESALKTAVTSSVEAAIAKYAASLGQSNTGLTAEEVKYIVEQAVSKSGGATEAQVKAIVTQAASSISGTQLSAAQVQRIVDAASTKITAAGLTAADVSKALATAMKNMPTNADLETVETKLTNAINTATAGKSTLTTEEVETIVAKYVYSNGTAKGDYTWYAPEATEMIIETADTKKAAEALVGLATLTTGGETFEGKTIVLPKVTSGQTEVGATITLSNDEDWNPIKSFAGTLEGNGATINGVKFEIVYFTTDEKQCVGTAAYTGYNTAGDFYGNKTAFGFINELAEGATVKDITVTYSMTSADWGEDPGNKYTYFGGVVGVAKPGSTIENCKASGTIYSWNRTGGVVGWVYNGSGSETTIKNCSFTGEIHTRMTKTNDDYQYAPAGGIVGYCDGYAKLVIDKCAVSDVKLTVYDKDGVLATGKIYGGSIVGYCSYYDNVKKGENSTETNVVFLNLGERSTTHACDATKANSFPQVEA